MPSFPRNRIWLSVGLSEPVYDHTGASFFALRSGDGRRAIVRQWLETGLVETVTAEPSPGGTVGYGGGTFAVHKETLVYAAGGRLIAIDLSSGTQRDLTPQYEGAAAPVISPCGRFVAFVIESDGHADVLVTAVEGDALPVKALVISRFCSESDLFTRRHTHRLDRVAHRQDALGRIADSDRTVRP